MPAGSRPLVGSSRISSRGELAAAWRRWRGAVACRASRPCSGPVATLEPDLGRARRRPRLGDAVVRASSSRFLRPVNVGTNFGCSTTAPMWPHHLRAAGAGTGSPKQPHLAGGDAGQTQQHPDRGGLAGAVGPEEAVHAAPPGRRRSSASTATTRRPRRVRNTLRRPVVSMTRSCRQPHIESTHPRPGARGHARAGSAAAGGQQPDAPAGLGLRREVRGPFVRRPGEQLAQMALDERGDLGDGDVAPELGGSAWSRRRR